MQIGPRYKKARYLGATVFRKTQTQKYSIRAQRKNKVKRSHQGGKSEYGRQMLEKQKARYSYGVSSGQFTKYVKGVLDKKGNNVKNLINVLESRLDNCILRAGFAPSRSAARQMVSHGHILVNGVATTVPSCSVSIGDRLSLRESSKKKAIFAKLDEQLTNIQYPAWMKIDKEKKEISIVGEPTTDSNELLFDIGSVLEFYTR